jgi:hypothetical protein
MFPAPAIAVGCIIPVIAVFRVSHYDCDVRYAHVPTLLQKYDNGNVYLVERCIFIGVFVSAFQLRKYPENDSKLGLEWNAGKMQRREEDH